MTFRHPYRLLAVLASFLLVAVMVTAFMISAGANPLWAAFIGWLSLFPASALFFGAGLAYEARLERIKR